MNTATFRYDINGLRALAVFSVLVFHFNRSVLPGGFIGVDVFFVISGFLMTSIIFRGLEGSSFSLFRFYLARAKRIVPALTVVVFVLLILGFLLLEPMSYQILGKHARDSLLFTSNFTYLKEAGYFDIEGYKKLLLHTWSLSVEWQFYLAYPILLIILARFACIKNIKKIVLVSTVLLIILCIYTTQKTPEKAYFMLYTRAWEMLLGGVAYLYPIKRLDKKIKPMVELVGIALIVFSCFVLNESTPWPGYSALFPTVGAYLVIIACNEKSYLSGYIIQKIGLWSYSIYLLHWPIIVLLKQLGIENHFYFYFPTVILLSFLLYEFVEKKRNYGKGLLFFFAVVLASSIYVRVDGVKTRVPEEYRLSSIEYRFKFYGGSGIPMGGVLHNLNPNGKEKIIITGDSLARQYVNSLIKNDFNVYSIMEDGCISTKNYFRAYSPLIQTQCNKRYESLVETITENQDIKTIIYAQYWADYENTINKKTGKTIDSLTLDAILDEMTYLIDTLNERQKLILIGKPQGTDANLYECLARQNIKVNFLYKKECSLYEERKIIGVNEKLKDFSKRYDNVYYIDPNDIVCKGKCFALTEDNRPIYSDSAHFSIYGAAIIGEEISNKINELYSSPLHK